MTTRVKMIIETLKANPEKKFTARDLAEEFIQRYPKDIAKKQSNPRYNTKDKLITQLAAEIGGKRTVQVKKKCPNITTIDQPRPRIYYWSENQHSDDDNFLANEQEEHSNIILPTLKEYDLYPMLIEYMKDQGLYCQRINEKTSVNSRGTGGNHWLHPDIVALEPLDQQWNDAVRSCVRNSNNSSIRLWSFEVKKQLTKGNVRECFFQAVSNSSWATMVTLLQQALMIM